MSAWHSSVLSARPTPSGTLRTSILRAGPDRSDSRSTSVGTLAIERYLRPVSYQDIPQALLPDVLRDGAPNLARQ